jgi:hypothetical protein
VNKMAVEAEVCDLFLLASQSVLPVRLFICCYDGSFYMICHTRTFFGKRSVVASNNGNEGF